MSPRNVATLHATSSATALRYRSRSTTRKQVATLATPAQLMRSLPERVSPWTVQAWASGTAAATLKSIGLPPTCAPLSSTHSRCGPETQHGPKRT